MTYSYTATSQTLNNGVAIPFNDNGVQTGCSIKHSAGTPSFTLCRPGQYVVHFNANVANATAESGIVSATLYVNGVAYPGAIAANTSAGTTDIGNIAFTVAVDVLPNCCAIRTNLPTTITVNNTGLQATYSNVALTITRKEW